MGIDKNLILLSKPIMCLVLYIISYFCSCDIHPPLLDYVFDMAVYFPVKKTSKNVDQLISTPLKFKLAYEI